MKISKNPQSVFFVGEYRYGSKMSRIKLINAENAENAMFRYVQDRQADDYGKLEVGDEVNVFAASNEGAFTIVELDEDKTEDEKAEEPETGQLEAVADDA